MTDAELRALERRAVDDPEAAARLARARERTERPDSLSYCLVGHLERTAGCRVCDRAARARARVGEA